MEIVLVIGFLVVLRLLFRPRTFKIILGFLLMLASVPAGIMFGLTVNGCCGAPSSGFEGFEYVLMSVLFVGGLILTIHSIRSNNKT